MHDADLGHRLLRVTDRAVAAEAGLVRVHQLLVAAEARAVSLDAELAVCRRRVQALAHRNDHLSGELAAVRASQTWRVGRVIVQPLSRAVKVVKRRSSSGRSR